VELNPHFRNTSSWRSACLSTEATLPLLLTHFSCCVLYLNDECPQYTWRECKLSELMLHVHLRQCVIKFSGHVKYNYFEL